MLIRPAAADELDAVGELTVAAYTGDGHLQMTSDYVDHLRDARSRARDATLLVAVEAEGSPVLGTVTFCLTGTPYADVAEAGEAEFRMLAVDPSARGQGIGRQLVLRCIDLARAVGAKRLAISSMQTMADAHRLYDRLGFRRAPLRDWEPEPGVVLLAYLLPL